MLSANWKQIPNKHYFLAMLALVIALFCSFSMVVYRQYEDSQKLNAWALKDAEIIRQGRLLLFDMLNMETGVRGYLLTGRKKFLAPYETAQKQIPKEVEALRADLMIGDADKEVMEQWLQQIADVQQTQQRQMQAYDNGGHDTFSANALELQKVQMDSLRQTLETYIAHRLDELQIQTVDIKHKQQKFISILLIGTIVAIMAMTIAILIIFVHIARAEESKAEIEKSEERFRTIMSGLNDGVYDFFPTEGKLYMSPGLRNILGYSLTEFPSNVEAFNKLVHPEDLDEVWDIFHQYARREINDYHNVFRMLHKDGEWRWILERGIGFWDEHGTLQRLIGTQMDISEQKRHEDELLQVNNELESFTYVASHDLRSPLVNLKGFAKELHFGIGSMKEVIEEIESTLSPEQNAVLHQALDKDIPEALGFIEKATDRMDRLTSAVLDLSRIGKREYHIEYVDVDALVKKCLAAQAYEINRTKTEIECAALPAVHCDALALEQVFANLIDNAVKYMDSERTGKIVISARDLPADVIFTVKDNGRGIDPSDQKKIFEMFRRARNTGDVRGTGMGMAFVRATLRKLGGSVWCESTAGVGSSFHIRIPKRLAKGLAA